MPGFSKLFPFIPRFFPPQGRAPIVVPSEVGENVSLTHELYRWGVMHDFQLRAQTSAAISVGAGFFSASVIDASADPDVLRIPVWASFRYQDAAGPRNVRVRANPIGTGPNRGGWERQPPDSQSPW